MKAETAKQRITKAIEKVCPNETDKVKKYLLDLIYDSFTILEQEELVSCSSSKTLQYAIAIDLEDNLEDLLREARKETA